MYNEEILIRVRAATPWAGGADENGNKMHGITLTCAATVTEPDFFKDLGYGKGAKYVNALLGGALPIEPPYRIRYTARLARLDVREPVASKVSVPVEVTEIATSPLLQDHFDVWLELKCSTPSDEVMGKLAKLKGEAAYITLRPYDGELFEEDVKITVRPHKEPEEEVTGDAPELPLEKKRGKRGGTKDEVKAGDDPL